MKIDGATKLLGLIGDPISHSLSPRIQNHALRRMDENLIYLPFKIGNDQLSEMIRLFPKIGGIGLNVTTPFKEEVGAIVGAGSEEVSLIGAVNTIVYRESAPVGYSTDGLGFRNWLHAEGLLPVSGKSVLLGFGATVRSIVYHLAGQVSLVIVTRDPHAAERTIQSWQGMGWPGEPPEVIGWNERLPESVKLAVAGLPQPFAESDSVSSWISCLDTRTVVVDLNYGTGRTPFLERAREHGFTAFDGTGLLVHQAALSLELWLGREIDADLLKEALREE